MPEKLQYPDLMLDIETMGTENTSAIISIGAVEFDIRTGETGKMFYQNIDLKSCLNSGLTVDASTIIWWMKQSEEARTDFINMDSIHLNLALGMFSDFCNKDYMVWANSPRFDCGILQNAYSKINQPIPWDFRKERCVRTLVSFNPKIRNNFTFQGAKHNATDDCHYQIGYCCEIFKSLNH